MVAAIGQLCGALGELKRRSSEDALSLIRWLPHQWRTLQNTGRFRLLRTGNQLGKTTVGLAEVIYAAIGVHPCRTPSRKSGEYWIFCASWSQSVAIQKKLWALLPKSRIHPDTEFSQRRGIRGKDPAVEVLHEDGTYSTIRIKTTMQGALVIAGATIHGALFDEPPSSQRVYTEVSKRVQATGGWVLITMTPINAPVDWIRELVTDGGIEDIHARLQPSATVPVGHDQPVRITNQDGEVEVWDQAWIDEVIRLTPAHEIPVTCHGEWESRTTDAYFHSAWRRPVHVDANVMDAEILLHVGADHGDRPGKQVILLVCIDPADPVGIEYGRPGVYVLDEYVDRVGSGDPSDDARGLLAMLRRYGWEWSDVDCAMGDKVHMKGTARQKSCSDLQAAIGREIGLPFAAVQPPILSSKRGEGRGRGAPAVGLRWLHAQLARDLLRIHPRCTRLIEAIERYKMAPNDEYADPIDALRYALDPYIFKPQNTSAPAVVRIG